MRPWSHLGRTCVLCCAIAGCSNQPEVAPVRGLVTMDGKPLPGGRVMFQPIATGDDKNVGKVAMGQIQPDGSFVLTTYKNGDGAVVGPHHPVVMENRHEEATNSDRPTKEGPRIGVVTLDELVFDVVAGKENVFTIEMDSKSYEVRNAVPEKGL